MNRTGNGSVAWSRRFGLVPTGMSLRGWCTRTSWRKGSRLTHWRIRLFRKRFSDKTEPFVYQICKRRPRLSGSRSNQRKFHITNRCNMIIPHRRGNIYMSFSSFWTKASWRFCSYTGLTDCRSSSRDSNVKSPLMGSAEPSRHSIWLKNYGSRYDPCQRRHSYRISSHRKFDINRLAFKNGHWCCSL
jgi:hypothetical protein